MRFVPGFVFVSSAVIILSPGIASGEEGMTWNCRNADFEISCSEGTCVNADAHTAMDVHVSPTEVSWCAYSGCWTGAPSAVLASGPFVTFSGIGLQNAEDTSGAVDVTVIIDLTSNAASILAAGEFTTPATCEKK